MAGAAPIFIARTALLAGVCLVIGSLAMSRARKPAFPLRRLAIALALLLAGCGSEPQVPAPPAPVAAGGTSNDSPPVVQLPMAPPESGGGTSALGESGPDENTPLQPTPEPQASSAPNAAGYVWNTVTIGGGGFVSGIITSRSEQDLVYARTDVGGAYRWSEPSQRWVALMDWIAEDQKGLWGVESLAIDPGDPERVYLLAGIEYFDGGKTAILASEDAGETFTVHEVTAQFSAHGNGMGRQSGERLAVDPNDGTILFTGTRKDGLFKSADRGQTWQRVGALDVTTTPNGNSIAFVVFDPRSAAGGSSQRLYVGVSRSGESNLFQSTDGGASFSPVAAQPTNLMPQRAVLGDDAVLYVTYANGAGPFGTMTDTMDQGAIWKLDTASGQWAEISPLRGGANRAFGGISVSPGGERIVASTINTYQEQPWGYGDRIFLSEDGGASWTDLIGASRVAMDVNGFPWMEGNAIHWAGSIELDPFDPERVWVASGNGIFMSENLSAAPSTWKVAGKGLEETVPLDAVSVPGGSLVSVIGDYDGFVHDDLTASPRAGRHAPTMGTTSGVAVAAANPRVLARVGEELYLSSDGATSWQLAQRPNGSTGGSLALSSDGAVLLWSVDEGVQRTANGGTSWSRATGIDFESAVSADAVNPSKFYAYDRESGAFVVSADGGASFQTSATLASRGALRVRALPGVEGNVWVALGSGGLTHTTDSGGSFQAIASVQRADAVGFGAAAPGQSTPAVYIWGRAGGGALGIYRSVDGGASWLRINDDAHEYGGPGNGQFVIGDLSVYGRVYMSTAGRGIVYGEVAPASQ
jgi:hypothetical protein